MSRLRGWLADASWATRVGVAFVLGVLATGAMAPFYLVFLLVPAFTGLVWLIFSAPGMRAAAAIGWWFGLGYFSSGLYWVSNALVISLEKLGGAITAAAYPAVLALAAGFALYPALASMLTRRLGRGLSAVGQVLVLAAVWTAVEWLRGWLLTGFPWNPIGAVWVFSDAMIQSVALIGTYGLGLLTIIAAAMPGVLADGAGKKPLIMALALLAAVWAGGVARLTGATTEMVADVRLRLVQPNIPQRDKWRPSERRKNLSEHIRMSIAATDGPPPTHVIWSETAATYTLANDRGARNVIAAAVPDGGLLITGAPRSTPRGAPRRQVWNSLHALNGRGDITATYDKQHLVPFGEYMPLKGWFGIAKLTEGATDFSAGPGPQTLNLNGLPPVSPLICYEAIFPGRVVDKRDRPQWLLNITNDAWYGISTGPYQHFDQSRLRAVEEGLPLVRVAGSGISAIVDGYGRVIGKLGLGEKGVLDGGLPRPPEGWTLYSRLADWLVGMLVLLVLGGGLLMRPSGSDRAS
ncbi:MAG: apolipoprotein N-acyltransferase [Alphaproteobacteria bacterium]